MLLWQFISAHIRALGRGTDWSEALLCVLSQGTRLTEALPCSNCVLCLHHGSLYHRPGRECRGVRIGEQHGLILEVAQDSCFFNTGWHSAHGYCKRKPVLLPVKKGDAEILLNRQRLLSTISA